jgi:hypothetical protein
MYVQQTVATLGKHTIAAGMLNPAVVAKETHPRGRPRPRAAPSSLCVTSKGESKSRVKSNRVSHPPGRPRPRRRPARCTRPPPPRRPAAQTRPPSRPATASPPPAPLRHRVSPCEALDAARTAADARDPCRDLSRAQTLRAPQFVAATSFASCSGCAHSPAQSLALHMAAPGNLKSPKSCKAHRTRRPRTRSAPQTAGPPAAPARCPPRSSPPPPPRAPPCPPAPRTCSIGTPASLGGDSCQQVRTSSDP